MTSTTFMVSAERSVHLYPGQHPADQMTHPFSERVGAPVRDPPALRSATPLYHCQCFAWVETEVLRSGTLAVRETLNPLSLRCGPIDLLA